MLLADVEDEDDLVHLQMLSQWPVLTAAFVLRRSKALHSQRGHPSTEMKGNVADQERAQTDLGEGEREEVCVCVWVSRAGSGTLK